MIQLYNTLSRKKEVFTPIVDGEVSMYVCGPTVYNYIHIGNARSTVAFDTIRKYLEYRGFKVNYVSNFTDVDDKIIREAENQGVTPEELSKRFIEAFFEDTAALNVKRATVHPTVMETMDDIITFIKDLIDKGVAYESEGDVYFLTESFKDYGKLSDQQIQELRAGASERTAASDDQKKRNILDFALWKSAKPKEISWNSPWGKGRPGWHIECSVMATKYLGDTIDIHAGGQDLAFPHHENEIAQSESKTGKPFANYWIHNAFVTIGETDEKMSKSLGNFVLLHDLLQQVDPQVIRFFLSTAHYRRPIRFTETSLKEAEVVVNRIQTTFANTRYRLETSVDALEDDTATLEQFMALENQFIKEMDDDFNAANGATVLYQWLREWNVYLEKGQTSTFLLQEILEKSAILFAIFGFKEKKEQLLDETIQSLIEERLQARKEKNFQRSDEIRNQLKAQGIILEDTPQGTRWRRTK